MNRQNFSNVTLPTFVLNYQGYAVGKGDKIYSRKIKTKAVFDLIKFLLNPNLICRVLSNLLKSDG